MIAKPTQKTLIIEEDGDEIKTRLLVEEMGRLTVYQMSEPRDDFDLMQSSEVICELCNQERFPSKCRSKRNELRRMQMHGLALMVVSAGYYAINFSFEAVAIFFVGVGLLAIEPVVYGVDWLRGKR